MRKRFTETQIISALKKRESGVFTKEVCWELDISEATFFKYNKVKINTETGKLVDGNTRIYEIQRRGLDVDVPLEKYTPDNSHLPDLKEPPKK